MYKHPGRPTTGPATHVDVNQCIAGARRQQVPEHSRRAVAEGRQTANGEQRCGLVAELDRRLVTDGVDAAVPREERAALEQVGYRGLADPRGQELAMRYTTTLSGGDRGDPPLTCPGALELVPSSQDRHEMGPLPCLCGRFAGVLAARGRFALVWASLETRGVSRGHFAPAQASLETRAVSRGHFAPAQASLETRAVSRGHFAPAQASLETRAVSRGHFAPAQASLETRVFGPGRFTPLRPGPATQATGVVPITTHLPRESPDRPPFHPSQAAVVALPSHLVPKPHDPATRPGRAACRNPTTERGHAKPRDRTPGTRDRLRSGGQKR